MCDQKDCSLCDSCADYASKQPGSQGKKSQGRQPGSAGKNSLGHPLHFQKLSRTSRLEATRAAPSRAEMSMAETIQAEREARRAEPEPESVKLGQDALGRARPGRDESTLVAACRAESTQSDPSWAENELSQGHPQICPQRDAHQR